MLIYRQGPLVLLSDRGELERTEANYPALPVTQADLVPIMLLAAGVAVALKLQAAMALLVVQAAAAGQTVVLAVQALVVLAIMVEPPTPLPAVVEAAVQVR
jgi:hypothetical protein